MKHVKCGAEVENLVNVVSVYRFKGNQILTS